MDTAAKLREFDTGDFPVAWREEMDGLVAEIEYEQGDTSFANPRDYECNLGVMLCWHTDYVLGDKQFVDGAGRGAVETRYDRSDFDSIGELAARLIEDGAVCVLPLYLLDHSGLSISAGAGYVGRGDTASGGSDEFGNARGWDTSLVGVIYTTPERIREFCGDPVRPFDQFYCPRDWSGTPEAWITKQLVDEVEIYDRYLRGEVYWWCVKDEGGDTIESCCGFLPSVGVPYNEELDYIREDAHEALVAEVEQKRERAALERVEATRAANMDIATK